MTPDGDDADLVSFVARDDAIQVRDELEAQRIELGVPDHDGIELASTDQFLFPVDSAVAVTVPEFTVFPHSALHVRDEHGEYLGELTSNPREFPAGTYSLEIGGSVKTYVRVVDAPFTAAYRSANLDYAPLDVAFESPTTILVGARSVHSRPQATVTVPDDPAALLEALPYLASSLKESSPERSWPTLRGHPPALDRGPALEVPDALSPPDTGVTVEVPATYADCYRVAPLAFYLGADVVAADRPALRLDNGHVEPLVARDRSLEATVESVLGRCLLLDSLTRIGGYYSLQRHEYDALAPELPFYPPNLYDASLSDQLIEYLEVEEDVLAPYRPQWPYLPTLRPGPADAQLLPSLLDSLVPVRVDADGAPAAAATAGVPGIRETRDTAATRGTGGPQDTPDRGAARGTGTASEAAAGDGRPPTVPPLIPATSAPRADDGVVQLHRDAFRHALGRTTPEPGDARLAFVLADADRADRLREYVAGARQSRLRAATVDVVVGSSPSRLAGALAADPSFLYYEPAVDGVSVADAFERAGSPEEWPSVVAVGAPVAPALAGSLATRGTVGGVAATAPPSVAVLGRVASLLVAGQSLERSVAFAEPTPGYRFFGKPGHVLVRREHGVVPAELDVRSRTADEHEVVRWAPPVETVPLGSVTRVLNERPEDAYHLVGTAVAEAAVHSTEDVVALLADDDYVVRLNGRPYHGEREATPALVRESAGAALRRRREDRSRHDRRR